MKAREMAPVAPHGMNAKQIRSGLTPFGREVALQPGERSVTEFEAIGLLRTILTRYGREHERALRQADGSMRPTWYEAPEIWIAAATSNESAVIVTEDAEGPVSLRVVTQLADGTKERLIVGKGERQ